MDIDVTSMPSPPTLWLDNRQMPMFGAEPLQQEVPIVRCHECQKPILASAIVNHQKVCATKRAKSGGKHSCAQATSVVLTYVMDAGSGKRKAEDDGAEQPLKKKTKKELAKEAAASKNTKGRIKGPPEYDKHCCVINAKGVPCSRSITCKVHSMVAKRSVIGRSKGYDELLLDWKRANVPGFVEPQKKETKAERKAKKEAEKEQKRQEMIAAGIIPGSKKNKSKGADGVTKKSKKAKAAAGVVIGDKPTKGGKTIKTPGFPEEEEEEEDYDSEVEMESLLTAVRLARPFTAVPLAQPTNPANFFVSRNEVLRNCTDTMRFALSGSNLRAEMSGTAVSLG
jgi:SAGA-associated factor 73